MPKFCNTKYMFRITPDILYQLLLSKGLDNVIFYVVHTEIILSNVVSFMYANMRKQLLIKIEKKISHALCYMYGTINVSFETSCFQLLTHSSF